MSGRIASFHYSWRILKHKSLDNLKKSQTRNRKNSYRVFGMKWWILTFQNIYIWSIDPRKPSFIFVQSVISWFVNCSSIIGISCNSNCFIKIVNCMRDEIGYIHCFSSGHNSFRKLFTIKLSIPYNKNDKKTLRILTNRVKPYVKYR